MTEVELTIKGDVTRMRLEPGDKVVVTLDRRHLSMDEHDRLHALVKSVFPDHEVLVVAGDIRLDIVQ